MCHNLLVLVVNYEGNCDIPLILDEYVDHPDSDLYVDTDASGTYILKLPSKKSEPTSVGGVVALHINLVRR